MTRWITISLLLATSTSFAFGDETSKAKSDVDLAEVVVELHEGIPTKEAWDFELPDAADRYTQPTMVFVGFPNKYTSTGVIGERSNPFLLRAQTSVHIAVEQGGEYEFILRSKGAARVFVDDREIAHTKFLIRNANGHELVPELKETSRDDLRPLPPGCQEQFVKTRLEPGQHHVRLEAIVGGKGLRLELNELCVAWARAGERLKWLGPKDHSVAATEETWGEHTERLSSRLNELNTESRRKEGAEWLEYWQRRHEFARQYATQHTVPTPPADSGLPTKNDIDRYVNAKLTADGIAPAPLTDDLAFLRRATLDTVGVIPTRKEIAQFLADEPGVRRAQAIERLLVDNRWADHWVSYWQDVLAENPGILKPELNNTGPFRWWIYESLLDNKPLDQFATELIMMDGSVYHGGPAGFGLATQNDVPTAAKAHVLAKAFLAMELNCARCHDAPYHPFKQEELFGIAAMLHRKPIKLPATSSVKQEPGGRVPLIKISLKAGQEIKPAWPFAQVWKSEPPQELIWKNADDQREQLALQLTAPQNDRFSKVMVNRLWQRLLGRGLIEPVDDWEAEETERSHAELLDYMAREFVLHGYDLKHVARLIMSSHTYQRESRAVSTKDSTKSLASAARRRLTAEQIVDSLFAVSGKDPRAEQLTLDPEGRQPVDKFLNLGVPRRAWQYTSLSNERDRPALALPVAQSFVDLLVAFGWRDARQSPLTVRDQEATALQPLTIANGVVGNRTVRLSEDNLLTELSLRDQPLEKLIDDLFLSVLTRLPTDEERKLCLETLRDGYELRRQTPPTSVAKKSLRRNAVSWSNHLNSEATKIKQELEREVLAGDPPSLRLQSQWRERMEDVIWALVNSPEFVFAP